MLENKKIREVLATTSKIDNKKKVALIFVVVVVSNFFILFLVSFSRMNGWPNDDCSIETSKKERLRLNEVGRKERKRGQGYLNTSEFQFLKLNSTR